MDYILKRAQEDSVVEWNSRPRERSLLIQQGRTKVVPKRMEKEENVAIFVPVEDKMPNATRSQNQVAQRVLIIA